MCRLPPWNVLYLETSELRKFTNTSSSPHRITISAMDHVDNRELLEMILLYGACNRNGRMAARRYAELFPNNPHPDHRFINRLVSRLSDTGTFAARARTGRPPVQARRANEVLEHIREHPHDGTRGVGRELGMSHTSVWRILRDHHYHPFRIHLHQDIGGNDYQRRMDVCNWILYETDQDEQFMFNLMTSDESTFYRDGRVNRHNMHYWSAVNPHWLRSDTHQQNWRTNVWCALHRNTVLGPIFLDNALNGQRYLHHLQTVLEPYADNLPLRHVQQFWFQHDGAPPHSAGQVTEWLDQQFPDRWVGRYGPVAWPARSPDLTPMDFFLWGYIKSLVYETASVSLADLQNRIRQACATITPELLANVRRTWLKRLQDCIIAEGHLFEHYY